MEWGLTDPEMHPKIRLHIRKAKTAGRCQQCQYPWRDGKCSCGKWGAVENEIARIAFPILQAREQALQREAQKRLREEEMAIAVEPKGEQAQDPCLRRRMRRARRRRGFTYEETEQE